MSWYRDLSLRWKLILAFVLVGLIPFAIGSYIAVQESTKGLIAQTNARLEGVTRRRVQNIQNMLKESIDDLSVLEQSVDAFLKDRQKKNEAINALKAAELERFFEQHYAIMGDIPKNLRFTESIQLFNEAFRQGIQSDAYRALVKEREPGLKLFAEQFVFTDLYLIDPEGNVVYTLAKHSDLGGNVVSGNLRKTGLGRLYEKARKEIALEDFSYYEPVKAQEMFIGGPLSDAQGNFMGVVAFQMDAKPVDTIVQQREGMSSTFESYLVGKGEDGKVYYRSNRVVRSGKIGEPNEDADAAAVVAGQSGVFSKYLRQGGAEVLQRSFARPLKIPGLNWGLLTVGNIVEAVVPTIEGSNEDYFSRYIKFTGNYDIFLIDPKGFVFYSVSKEADLNTNILDGKFANSNFSKAVAQAIRTKQVAFVDYARYAPSNNQPAAFMVKPVMDKGEIAMLIAIQFSGEELQNLIGKLAGMGKSGEVYVASSDLVARTNLRYTDVDDIVTTKVESNVLSLALKGETGFARVDDYRGVFSLIAYQPVELGKIFPGLDFEWAVITKEDDVDALSVVYDFQRIVMVIALIVLAAVVVFAFLIAQGIAKPILTMASTVGLIAQNQDLTLQVPVSSKDEIGRMTEAFNHMLGVFRNSMKVVQGAAGSVGRNSQDVAKRASANRERAAAQFERAEASQRLIAEMGGTAGQVSAATREQEAAALKANDTVAELMRSMETVAKSAIEQNEEVGTTMERVQEMGATGGKVAQIAAQQGEMVVKVSESMNAMAKAVEEMTKAVSQANEQGRSVLTAAQQGTQTVRSTVDGMKAISESSEQISEIIGVITEIAEQTNLLALNAAIEAARAGAHGKGFAVVADEVGKLAQRSSEAAKEITQLIKDSTNRVAEGSKLSDESQKALVRIDEGGRRNMESIDAISKTADQLARSTIQVQAMMKELNVLAQQIGAMSGEQGERRRAAERSLRSMIDHTRTIGNLVQQASVGAQRIGQEMQGILKRTTEVTGMTAAQAERSKNVNQLAQETADTSKQTVEGAGMVVSITEELQKVSQQLIRQVQQFKI